MATGALLAAAPLVIAAPFTAEAGAAATGDLEALGPPAGFAPEGAFVLPATDVAVEGFTGPAWVLAAGMFAVVAVPAAFVVALVLAVPLLGAPGLPFCDGDAAIFVGDFAAPAGVPAAPVEFPDFAPVEPAVAGVLVALLELLAVFAVDEVVLFDDAAGEAPGDGLAVALDELGLFCAAAITVTADASARI